jgi:hypothetical protein
MLARVEFHARVKRQHDQLAGGVAGERHPARPVGEREHERHAAEDALHPAAGRHRGDRRRLVLPEQHMVLEVDGVPLPECHLGDGDQLTLDLHGRAGEAELGEVPQARRLTPARVGDKVPHI